ncbi:MAG: helix-turn-helix domain-containing protein [Phycisphaerae bacterium]
MATTFQNLSRGQVRIKQSDSGGPIRAEYVPTAPRGLLHARDVAVLLKVTPGELWNLRGELPPVFVGWRKYYAIDAVEAFLEGRRHA